MLDFISRLKTRLRARGALLHAFSVSLGFGALFGAFALSALDTGIENTQQSASLVFSESSLSESSLIESAATAPIFSESPFSAVLPVVLDFLLSFAFCCLFVALFLQLYAILRVKKQAKIKAYFKPNSPLHRYFGRFFITKILAFFATLLGLVPLFFMLLFPNEGEILSLWLLLPCAIYGYKFTHWLFGANISEDFAPILAKKYTALCCGVLAVVFCMAIGADISGGIGLDSQISRDDFALGLEQTLAYYHISSFGLLWQEILGFVLTKQFLFHSLYASLEGAYMAQLGLKCLYLFGLGASFTSFTLLVLGFVGGKVLESSLDSEISETRDLNNQAKPFTKPFGRFFNTLFFLIFLGLAFVASALCVKLLHTLRPESSLTAKSSSLYESLSLGFMRQNAKYIEIMLDDTRHFVKESELGALEGGLGRNLIDFEAALNRGSDEILEEFFAQREVIIDEYAKWYFSVYGEYTRLFYAALGKGEDIAQEQFVFLLKAHTPFDLQSRLEALYKSELSSLHERIKQSVRLHSSTQPRGELITQSVDFGEFNKNVELLTPRLSDKISAALGLSLAGALVLKSSAKALSKSSAKLVGKSALKKGVSGAVGAAGGSLVCGVFAPLCAVGLFVASDYAINSLDAALNEEDFKAEMRKGLSALELQLKTSLYDYNSRLSNEIYNALPPSLIAEQPKKESAKDSAKQSVEQGNTTHKDSDE